MQSSVKKIWLERFLLFVIPLLLFLVGVSSGEPIWGLISFSCFVLAFWERFSILEKKAESGWDKFPVSLFWWFVYLFAFVIGIASLIQLAWRRYRKPKIRIIGG